MKWYKYIPQLDYFFYKYWSERRTLTFDHIQIPVVEKNDILIPKGSFIELLFSDTFTYDDFEIMFKEVQYTTFSKPIMDRIQYSPSLIKTFVTDPNGTIDLFDIQFSDRQMLTQLFNYRRNLFVDLNMNYEDLETSLSKLIYLYLDLVLNGNFQKISEDLVCNEVKILENLFELYITNEAHRIMENNNFVIDSNILELRPVRDQKIFKKVYDSTADFQTFVESYDSTSFIDPAYMVLNETPYNNDIKAVFYNGELVDPSSYELVTDGERFYINWESSGIDIKDDDVFIVDYLTKVSSIDTATQPSDLRVDDLNKEMKRLEDDREVI